MKKYPDIFICTTDTVVGIGGPVKEQTLKDIYFLKNRPFNKKMIILVSSIKQAQSFSEWTKEATIVAQKYWPGPYTIIVNNQGFRMPDCLKLLEFLTINGPAYVTSANISGQKPLSFKETKQVFPHLGAYHNFGKGNNKPSTLINLDTGEILERE